MIRLDENALICDLAETYHILDYKSLPARLVAILSVGLGNDSRIRRKINDEKISQDTYILAAVADRLGMICYALSGDRKAMNPLFTDVLLGGTGEADKKSDAITFTSAEEFKEAWKKGGGESGD